MNAASSTDTRAEYCQGLRALADFLDATPAAPLPYEGQSPALGVFADDVPGARAWLGLPGARVARDPSRNHPVAILVTLAGLHVRVHVAASIALDVPVVTPWRPEPALAPWLRAATEAGEP